MQENRNRQSGTGNPGREWFRESPQPALLVDQNTGTTIEANPAARQLFDLPPDAPLTLFQSLARQAIDIAGTSRFHVGIDHGGRHWRCLVQLVHFNDGADGLLLALLYPFSDQRPDLARFRYAVNVIDSVCRAGDVEDTLRSLLDHSMEDADWRYAEAWLPDGAARLRSRCRRGRESVVNRMDDARTDVDADPGTLLERSRQTGIPQMVPDIRALPSTAIGNRDAMLAAGIRSAYILPLAGAGDAAGALLLGFAAQDRALRDRLDVLTGLAPALGALVMRRESETSLRERDELLQSLFRNLPCSIYRRVLHANGRVSYPYVGGQLLPVYGINPAAGFPNVESALEKVHAEDRDRFVREIYRSAREHSALYIEYRVVADDGAIRWWRTWSVPVGAAAGEDGSVAWDAFTLDITTEVELRHTAEEQLFRDPVTRLPTRQAFEKQLAELLAANLGRGERVAVLVFNVDRFRWINDAHGMATGDAALVAVAERLRDVLPADSVLARLGSDEFTVALGSLKDERELRRQLAVMNRVMHKPFRVFEQELHLSFTTGMCTMPEHGETAEELVRCASIAMHRGRRENKGKLTLFDPLLDSESTVIMTTDTELRRALRERQFEVHYQPQVSPDLERLVGFEALIRWRHPRRGLVPPNRFIPIAEETGLIEELFPYVLDCVCTQYAAWQRDGLAPPPVSVNISPVQIRVENRVAADVERLLRLHDVPPTCLKLEITEGTLLRNFGAGAQLLATLAEKGVAVVLDDFGVGYSSLGYLAQLPVRSLKIDRSFVAGLEQHVNAAKVLRAVITLAHSLDMEVTVEGVETEAQLDVLRQWRCHGIQGYLFSRPLPGTDATALLRKMNG